jgi:hypothetical protein
MSAGTTSQVAGYTFQTDRDAFYTGQVVEARFDEPTPAMSILEEDFTRLWGYLYSNLKAEVAFRGWHPPVPPTTPVSWTNDVLTSVPDWTRRQDLRLNRIVISGDWDKQSGDYVELARVEDTAAIDADGLAEMVVESKWLRTEHDGVTLAEARASRLALRTFRAPEELRCDTLFSQIDMGVGEEVQITQAQLPNLATGARGKVTELYEIVSVDANYPEAESQATLLRSYYNRPAFIAPNGQPNYTSATEAQRQFAYICNSSGLMSNGDKGYVVQ